MTGHRFDLRQANCSVSAAGVLRGLHFAAAAAEPGQVRDVPARRGVRRGGRHPGRLADVRPVGLGACSTTRTAASIYLSEGLGHGFLALEDDSTVMYLCSAGYAPEREHTICATDPALGIDWPVVDADAVRPRRRGADAGRGPGRRVCCRRGMTPSVRRRPPPLTFPPTA